MGGEYSSRPGVCAVLKLAAKIPLSFSAMRILALDTSTPAGSVALAAGGELTECRVGDADRTHGERLPGDVTALLATHGLTPADIDRYAVCSGPGSFTGLRVGLATIQALALVNRRPVVAVPHAGGPGPRRPVGARRRRAHGAGRGLDERPPR